MSDEQELAETVGRLYEENKYLKAQLNKANHDFLALKIKRYAWTIILIVLFSPLAVGLLDLVGYPIYKSFTTPYKVDHCYIEQEKKDDLTVFALVGNVPWHLDINHGHFTSIEEAIRIADMLHCPLSGTIK